MFFGHGVGVVWEANLHRSGTIWEAFKCSTERSKLPLSRSKRCLQPFCCICKETAPFARICDQLIHFRHLTAKLWELEAKSLFWNLLAIWSTYISTVFHRFTPVHRLAGLGSVLGFGNWRVWAIEGHLEISQKIGHCAKSSLRRFHMQAFIPIVVTNCLWTENSLNFRKSVWTKFAQREPTEWADSELKLRRKIIS